MQYRVAGVYCVTYQVNTSVFVDKASAAFCPAMEFKVLAGENTRCLQDVGLEVAEGREAGVPFYEMRCQTDS